MNTGTLSLIDNISVVGSSDVFFAATSNRKDCEKKQIKVKRQA